MAAACASLASDYPGASFRSRAVAGGAKFLARDFDFGVYTGRGFFKRQTHVVAQIGTAARTPAASPAAPPTGEKILEAEEVPEDVVEILEDRAAEIDAATRTGKASMAIGVVDLTFFRVTQHTVGFRAFAEFYLGIGFVLRMAVWMPLEGTLAVSGFNFLDGSCARYAEHFVIIALLRLCHCTFTLVERRANAALESLRLPKTLTHNLHKCF